MRFSPTIAAIAGAWLATAAGCDDRHRIGAVSDGGALPAVVTSALALDGSRTCALTSKGRVFCWGRKLPIGEPPPDPTIFDTTPTDQPALAGAVGIVGTDLASACALMLDHQVRCWGDNYDGQLGRGDVGGTTTVPGPVPGLFALQLAAGSSHRCALLANGTVSCWGSNGWGECGTAPSAAPQPSPTVIPGLTEVVEIVAALGHTCARRGDGSVWCFGFNQYGQLGSSDDGSHSGRLMRVGLPAPATHLGANAAMTCAGIAGAQGGEVWCWGVWKPETDTVVAAPPTHLFTGGAVQQIVGGPDRLCIVRSSTFDFVSGGGCADNAMAAPGQGVDGIKLTAIRGGPWGSIAVSESTACAIDAAGAVSCWGDNTLGQIGTGQAGDIWPTPTPVRW